ncbi:MAG: DUF2723 domain-containing protein, partial [Bacteroidota bacterium]|nr:DUF2723 domain-containing protein [Bacteroidota bacterium]
MNFSSYNRLNNLTGWLVFAVAAFTYLSTMEPTVSLWDCGEFVSASYKQQVVHPPGAPFFLLLNRIFTIPADLLGDKTLVPVLVNASSALCSAFTILFLVWSITALASKLVFRNETDISRGDLIAVLASGIIGGLCYTFSDTFWFSAVEGEVYAMSSFFTALVFWMALKWERRANTPYHLKWIILIFYMIGIVVGVHLLGLLVIPVLVLMYYFKKSPTVTWKGGLIAFVIGMAVLFAVQYGVIQYMPIFASKMELLFVNGFGMPYWSGVIFFYIVALAAAAYGIYYSHKQHKVILNTALICLVSVIIGYSSYAMIVIRSYSNPPIDMNDPEDVFSLISYLTREQYGDNYLVSGPYFSAVLADPPAYQTEENGTIWRKENGGYVEAGTKKKYVVNNPKYKTVFPRMFNFQEQYFDGYRHWGNIRDDNNISFVNNNLRFFFRYQVVHMYWRYFAWNFIGRQNDKQGMFGEFHQGNWITGISG